MEKTLEGRKQMLIIHDLSKEEWEELTAGRQGANAEVIGRSGQIRRCAGCFGCWVRTPGQCVLEDDYQKMGEQLGRTEELAVISRCSFGSYSSFVKNVFDRSISYVLPYFEIRQGEMHHKIRYKKELKICAYFYGEDITEKEKQTAEELVKANALNFNGKVEKVVFVRNKEALKEVIVW